MDGRAVSVDEELRKSCPVEFVMWDMDFSCVVGLLSMPLFHYLCGWAVGYGAPIFVSAVGRLKAITLVNLSMRRYGFVASHLADLPASLLGAHVGRTKTGDAPGWKVSRGYAWWGRDRLCNQEELIRERSKRCVFDARPGITGLAQINNIDMSTPELLADTDARMLQNLNLKSYFSYIFLTVAGKGAGDRVKGL